MSPNSQLKVQAGRSLTISTRVRIRLTLFLRAHFQEMRTADSLSPLLWRRRNWSPALYMYNKQPLNASFAEIPLGPGSLRINFVLQPTSERAGNAETQLLHDASKGKLR
jgi:hypothetical protein